jgi:hypothetical protein
LFRRHLKVVLLLQSDEHATEVLTNKVLKERVDGVAFFDAILLEKFVGEFGAGFEGKTLREDEGVVAVEEDVFDLDCQTLSVGPWLTP